MIIPVRLWNKEKEKKGNHLLEESKKMDGIFRAQTLSKIIDKRASR